MDRLSDYTGYLLRTAFLRSAALAARELDSDARPRDAAVLATLQAVGPLSQQELAKGVNVNRTVMVKLIDALEARGAVERVRNPSDRRAYALHATPTGLDQLTEMLPRLARAEQELTAALQPPERARLNELLRALIDPPPPVMADRTGFLLARAHHRFRERADAELAPLDLQVRHFGALTALAGGVPSQRELADRLGVSGPVVVEMVDALEARGFVERRREAADRRLNALLVTNAGRDVLQRATALLTAANHDLTQPIGEQGDRELRALLLRILNHT